MKRWEWMITLGILAALLFVTCQAGTGNGQADGVALTTLEPQPKDPAAPDGTPQDEKPKPAKPAKTQKAQEKAESTKPAKPESKDDKDSEFADFAFPPTVSDVDYHKDGWYKDDCLRCHETGVGDATVVEHDGMEPILLTAKCRSCHVLIPGQKPIEPRPSKDDAFFALSAFPPMIPASESHQEAWNNDNCMLCHETGVKDAPIVVHKNLPKVLLKAKCRSCHVQVRSAAVKGR